MPRLKLFENGSPFKNMESPSASIRSSALTSAGLVRPANEDAVSVVVPERQDLLFTRGVLAVVADGMGGVGGGSQASGTAVDTITRYYVESSGRPSRVLQGALLAANKTIFKLSKQNPTLAGMGTTCVALVLMPDQAWAAWVGDSRLYLIRSGQIFQLTEDHSWVSNLVREGILTGEQAACHEHRHVLTKALGTKPEVEVSFWEQPMSVRAGDRFLLCSDGLHDLLTENELLQGASAFSVEEATDALIQMAHDRGGYDNVSSVVLEVSPGPQPTEGTSKP
jgi:protein phosphatase